MSHEYPVRIEDSTTQADLRTLSDVVIPALNNFGQFDPENGDYYVTDSSRERNKVDPSTGEGEAEDITYRVDERFQPPRYTVEHVVEREADLTGIDLEDITDEMKIPDFIRRVLQFSAESNEVYRAELLVSGVLSHPVPPTEGALGKFVGETANALGVR